MGRGKALTNQEYWWIIGLHDGGISLHEISRKTSCFRTWLSRPQTDSSSDRPRAGRRLALTDREVRVLVRTAASGEYFAAELKTKLAIKASVRTIQRMLQRVDHLVYTKMDRTLPLTTVHKAARMAWAEEHILNPDGFKYYWRDMRRPAQSFVRRQNGGGSVMVWGTFSAQAVMTAWDSIEQEYLLKLVESMPRRFLAVIKQKRGLTKC
uniref:Tc3 transposase DNA binding domain-containing protein n=1 Tax=Phytophthora ramorum TaxID=164328 RepID=H3GJC1_PHYRM